MHAHRHGESDKPLGEMTEEELYELEIFHRMDHDWVRQKYAGFYGQVFRHQDDSIAKYVIGHAVLDAGAGYGWTTTHLRRLGYEVTPIDLHDAERAYARENYGVEILPGDIYDLKFADRSFDTVLVREVGEHLQFERAASELARVAARAVVLFQTNVSPLVRAMRGLAGHHEFSSPTTEHYIKELERTGMQVDTVRYSDLFAFALSGAQVTRQWLPPLPPLYPAVITADDALMSLARAGHLDRALAWRVLIRAVRR